MPQDIVQHALRAIGGDVAESVVVVLLVRPAQVAQVVEKVAGEQADADAQLQHEDLVFELSVLIGSEQAGEEDIGRVTGKTAVVVDDERHGRGVGEERLVAALAQVLLAELPFEALGERHEVLYDFAAGLGMGQQLLGGRAGSNVIAALIARVLGTVDSHGRDSTRGTNDGKALPSYRTSVEAVQGNFKGIEASGDWPARSGAAPARAKSARFAAWLEARCPK